MTSIDLCSDKILPKKSLLPWGNLYKIWQLSVFFVDKKAMVTLLTNFWNKGILLINFSLLKLTQMKETKKNNIAKCLMNSISKNQTKYQRHFLRQDIRGRLIAKKISWFIEPQFLTWSLNKFRKSRNRAINSVIIWKISINFHLWNSSIKISISYSISITFFKISFEILLQFSRSA